jgi:hypothetical protein
MKVSSSRTGCPPQDGQPGWLDGWRPVQGSACCLLQHAHSLTQSEPRLPNGALWQRRGRLPAAASPSACLITARRRHRPSLPLRPQPHRVRMTHDLVLRYDLYKQMDVSRARCPERGPAGHPPAAAPVRRPQQSLASAASLAQNAASARRATPLA